MRILITGASSNVGRGMIRRLRAAGHELVLSDLNKLAEQDLYAGLPFFQCDVQAGFGLERAAAGCDLILHLPAWHGMHQGQKTEVDYWRLNVDGTFWMFQAAQSAGITRVVFLSSQSWYNHYDKYGFTKRIGEELCEFNRRKHAIRYVAIRPAAFTPWGANYLNGYGARLLRGGVDREDILDCVQRSIEFLARPAQGEAEGVAFNAVRANAFTAEQVADWEANPIASCERIFPGSRRLVEKYALDIRTKPTLADPGEGAQQINWRPVRHFGTFIAELARLDAEGGEALVRAQRCPY